MQVKVFVRKVRVFALAAALLIVLSSCSSSPIPNKDEIFGVWKFSQKDSSYVSNFDNGEILFNKDMTFTLSEFPGEVVTFIAPSDKSTNESGTWEVIDKESETQKPGVSLTSAGSSLFPDGRRFSFVFDGENEPALLIMIVGDIDGNRKYVLQKVAP